MERNIDVQEKHAPTGDWPTTQACALIGNQTGNLLLCRMSLNQMNHADQGEIQRFLNYFSTSYTLNM